MRARKLTFGPRRYRKGVSEIIYCKYLYRHIRIKDHTEIKGSTVRILPIYLLHGHVLTDLYMLQVRTLRVCGFVHYI